MPVVCQVEHCFCLSVLTVLLDHVACLLYLYFWTDLFKAALWKHEHSSSRRFHRFSSWLVLVLVKRTSQSLMMHQVVQDLPSNHACHAKDT